MANCIEQTLVEYLFRFPIIKDYFLRYKLEEWPQVLSTTLLYGIQSIETSYNKFLPMAELNDRLNRIHSVKSIEDSIPCLKTKLGTLKREICDLEEKLVSKPSLKTETKLPEFEDFEVNEEKLPKSKPKMVDFWYQTDLRQKNDRRETKQQTKSKPWAHDYSKIVKNQRAYLNFEDLEN